MSIWAHPKHVVEVQLMDAVQDSRGAFKDVPRGARLEVACSVQSAREWSTAEENLYNGLQILDLCRVFARDWPGDARSLVFHEGHVWETVGSPQHFDMSARTEHWVVTLRKRGEDRG